ncbi:STP1 protein [Plasmodium malariae]|uniref:STP1 protein n=1 Tax=Plasmodium malariae TaxID=5858 RepID=A0A1A8WTB6_PLAMA|nr:STP1 protein [Plasmodium malariae]
MWRQWISKMCMIIEQYLELLWFKVLEKELQNISDEYEDELTRNDNSLMNREKLKHKEYYEKLCKYIKTNC